MATKQDAIPVANADKPINVEALFLALFAIRFRNSAFIGAFQ
jgi:hypothetical protein